MSAARDDSVAVGASLTCVVVLGPTACGKTRLAVDLARRFHGEIVSADSRQVYRGLDLGTGKDLGEYGNGPHRVRHHLIDVVEPAEDYHLFRFLADARQAVLDIAGRGCLPIVAGGTPLYLNALLDAYTLEGGAPNPAVRAALADLDDNDLLAILEREAPDLHRRVDRTQRRRLLRAVEIARTAPACPGAPSGFPTLRPLLLGPHYPRAELHQRIADRLDARMAAGLVAEVGRLHAGGLSWERLDWLGLEYRWVGRHLRGEMDEDAMRATLLARIRRFCKSQDVWFRRMERDGKTIHWIPRGDPEAAARLVRLFLAGQPLPAPDLRLNEILYGPRTSGPAP